MLLSICMVHKVERAAHSIDFDGDIIKAGMKLDVPESQSGTYNFDLWKKMTGHAPVSVRFSMKGTYPSTKPFTVKWDFGDGTTSSDHWPVHTYNRAGSYTVSLTFTSPDITLSTTKQHYITVLLLAHYYPAPQMGWAPSKVDFSDWSSGEPTSYLWDFDDGTTSTDKHPVHTYTKAGEYVPHLTVSRDGLSDTLTKVGASGGYGGAIGSGVIIVMPVADFSSSTVAGPAPLQVSFTNVSRGFPGSCAWNFGDGSPLNSETSPKHTYKKPGNYSVTLTVKTGNLQHQKTIQITVHELLFTITATAGPGGKISPAGAVKVKSGESQTFTFTPDAGKTLDILKVNGTVVTPAGTTYAFGKVTANHTIAVTFKAAPPPPPPPGPFTITATDGPGGAISPVGLVKVKSGESQTFTFTPDAGKTLDALNVNGTVVTPAGPTYTFSKVTANHTIAVTFKAAPPPPPPPGTFTITATTGPGGKISPAGAVKVKSGANQAFTFTPDTGKTIDVATVDGKPVSPTGATYTFPKVSANHTIAVTFKAAPPPPPPPGTFTITATTGPGGKISPAGAVKVKSGANQAFTFTPDTGKTIDVVTVDGKPVSLAGATYTFPKVSANHTIAVTFKAAPPPPPPPGTFTITATTGPGGKISPAGAVKVKSGANQAFTFTPDTGKTIDVVTVDGKPVSLNGATFTFPKVTANHTIAVTFKADPGNVTAFETIKKEMIDLINKERTSRGLLPYARDPLLDKVAQYA